ncbi:hypothetical protein [Rhizobium giardinii]|uniref:Uncharacterized protein n=1 Tax=Rhizobium giardinii TaxID=56731 RepID=A0A7W8XCE8_9HYPH|nr:hypothetical protein [Rhizobium giardinii]MBB5538818.1 hypothetical protein [Rhizobium giardinii]
MAARAPARGAAGEFVHWAKVAAEVARISPRPEMDFVTVAAIANEELGDGRTKRDRA